jgi:Domain of unknown function (DUF3943)
VGIVFRARRTGAGSRQRRDVAGAGARPHAREATAVLQDVTPKLLDGVHGYRRSMSTIVFTRSSARAAVTALLLLAVPSTRAESPLVPSEELPAPPSDVGLAFVEGPLLTNLVLNLGGRLRPHEDSYNSNWDTFIENLWGEWEFDPNSFRTNQFAHPYQGSLYFTAARSLGVGFHTSAALTAVGAWLWETAGESKPPAINDLITTSVAGTLFGEVLFRLSTLVLGDSNDPGFWRETGAFVIAPMHGGNRLLSGNRYRDRRLYGIPWYGEATASFGLSARSRVGGAPSEADGTDLTIAGRILHGVPGADWRFRRPFDHFDTSFALVLNEDALGSKAFGNLLVRGLVAGRAYGEGTSSGLWGLFAAYDYIAPDVFRASSSNVSLGTVGQVDLGRRLALQGTAYAGIGFGAAGASEEVVDERDYHFGLQAVGLAELSLSWAKRIRLRSAVRAYLVGDEWSPDPDSYEDVEYGIAELVLRAVGPHALAVGYTGARRRARYPDVPDVDMKVNQLSVSYRFVSDPALGAAY